MAWIIGTLAGVMIGGAISEGSSSPYTNFYDPELDIRDFIEKAPLNWWTTEEFVAAFKQDRSSMFEKMKKIVLHLKLKEFSRFDRIFDGHRETGIFGVLDETNYDSSWNHASESEKKAAEKACEEYLKGEYKKAFLRRQGPVVEQRMNGTLELIAKTINVNSRLLSARDKVILCAIGDVEICTTTEGMKLESHYGLDLLNKLYPSKDMYTQFRTATVAAEKIFISSAQGRITTKGALFCGAVNGKLISEEEAKKHWRYSARGIEVHDSALIGSVLPESKGMFQYEGIAKPAEEVCFSAINNVELGEVTGRDYAYSNTIRPNFNKTVTQKTIVRAKKVDTSTKEKFSVTCDLKAERVRIEAEELAFKGVEERCSSVHKSFACFSDGVFFGSRTERKTTSRTFPSQVEVDELFVNAKKANFQMEAEIGHLHTTTKELNFEGGERAETYSKNVAGLGFFCLKETTSKTKSSNPQPFKIKITRMTIS